MKKAFTLAEILIVLVVIGVLTAILLPVAFHAAPDENVMKFKKGYNTLTTVIRELVTSDDYYKDGDLGIKKDGSAVDSSTYFCKTFADIISTKSVNCSEDLSSSSNDTSFVQVCSLEGKGYCKSIETAKATVDATCLSMAEKVGAEIVAQNGIVYYQSAPSIHFGVNEIVSLRQNGMSDEDIQNRPNANDRLYGGTFQDENGFDRIYKIFCMDIDGINQGEAPFGFGIRADGKILAGQRADEWLEKSLQKED